MPYSIEFAASALKEFEALDKVLQKRISERILALAGNPFPPGHKKLQAQPDHYRIRVGDYRVIYRIDKGRIVVVIVRVGHRREIYR
jgi:mRNA interferase RelE/StbE